MRPSETIIRQLQLPQQFPQILSSKTHSSSFTHERLIEILSRVQRIAAIFAVLSLGWVFIDMIKVPWPVWGELAMGRIVCSVLFFWLAGLRVDTPTISVVYRRLMILFLTPIVFLIFAHNIFHYSHDQYSLAMATAYFYSPFIIVAGFGLFPLTAFEIIYLSIPLIGLLTLFFHMLPELLGSQSALEVIWVLSLVVGVASLSAMSQLTLMLKLFERGAFDNLTGLLSRRIGSDILNRQFQLSVRHDLPLLLLMLDLDHFKQANDRFGHAAGDDVLRSVAKRIKSTIRQQDAAIRWGGEEFLLMLPSTDMTSAKEFLDRLFKVSLATLPDGKTITASVGVAERRRDRAHDWMQLLKLADDRLYKAKQQGRNRYVTD